ncbi:MAG: epimerase [Planctomycetes bacterium]|nr:epimerase [Planctomycetota bacterium]
MERVLVTGGAGFIGSHAAEALLARGDAVTIVDSFDPFYDPALKRANLDEVARRGAFDLVEKDIRDRAAMGRVFGEGRFDLVVHLAAKAGVRPSIEDPGGYVSVNLDGSAVLFDLAVQERVSRVVFASSSSVYGNNKRVPFSEDDPVDHPVSPYAATKKAGELLAHSYHHVHGLPITCLRFFTVYGPRQRPEMAIHKFTRLIDQGEPVPFFGDGTSRRDYTYVDDIVDGVLRSCDRCGGFRIYNLGESHTTTLSRMVELIEGALGKSAVLDRLPFQTGDVNETFADVSRARKELGYAPSTLVEEGVPSFVEWYRSRHG